MLTGLGNRDGNRANHEVGICLPQFILNVTSSCTLSIRPKYAVGAYISLLVTGRDRGGANNMPVASDTAAAVADAVNNRMGYYYLDPVKCPQSYAMKIKGAALLSAGERRLQYGTAGPGCSVGMQCSACGKCPSQSRVMKAKGSALLSGGEWRGARARVVAPAPGFYTQSRAHTPHRTTHTDSLRPGCQ